MSQPSDEEIGAHIREMVADGDRDELRLMVFHEHVQDIPGLVGELLRQIAHAHSEFRLAVHAGGTTAGEETRLFGVLDSAVALADSLRDGGAL
jgi:hypothetical protein